MDVDAEPKPDVTAKINYHLITDRRVYRPGDTLHYWFLAARTCGHFEAHVLKGVRVNLRLKHDQTNLFSLDTVTNEHGLVLGEFVIPQQALPGSYSFCNYDEELNFIEIESYKQSTFQVSLAQNVPVDAKGRSVTPGLGDTVHVQGLAASYNQVALSDAQVKYSVTRHSVSMYGPRLRMEQDVICSGTTTTNAVGLFDIAFVVEPDSTMNTVAPDDEQKYVVEVSVTSPSGESNSVRCELDFGKNNSCLEIATSRNEILYNYRTRNGTLLKGDVKLAIHRMSVPKQPYLPSKKYSGHGIWEDYNERHTLSREDFHQRYPLFAYDSSECEPENFQIEATVFSTTMKCDGSARWQHVSMPELPSGMYLIEMSAGEASCRKVMDVVAPEAEHVQSPNLIWCDAGCLSGYMGDTVTLRVGSRYHGVRVVCAITREDGIPEHQLLQLNDNIVTLHIPLTQELLGRSSIMLYSVKEGRVDVREVRLWVDPPHKQLDVKLTSFRDKLVPGNRETFTFQVTDVSHHQPVQANLCLTMYDASMGTIDNLLTSRLSWLDFVDLDRGYYGFAEGGFVESYRNDVSCCSSRVMQTEGSWGGKYKKYNPTEWDVLPLWTIKRRRAGMQLPMSSDGMNTARGEDGMVSMAGKVREIGVDAVEDVAMGTSHSYLIETIQLVEELNSHKPLLGADSEAAMPRLRTNLSTLSFFEPMLTTQADGSLSYTFTVPDLLTQWNLGAWAWTDDLCFGKYFNTSIITQQKLMIMPTMPRFLRQGDTATLLAKVTNLADTAILATVECTLDIPSTNQQKSTQQLTIPPHSTLPVSFPVRALVGGTVAT